MHKSAVFTKRKHDEQTTRIYNASEKTHVQKT